MITICIVVPLGIADSILYCIFSVCKNFTYNEFFTLEIPESAIVMANGNIVLASVGFAVGIPIGKCIVEIFRHFKSIKF